MRLQNHESDSIKTVTRHVFGSDSKVILFGSRVNDTSKGGDIDLYIQPSEATNISRKKIDFLVELKLSLGDQKIDVIIARDPSRLIEQEALKNRNHTMSFDIENTFKEKLYECNRHVEKITVAKNHLYTNSFL